MIFFISLFLTVFLSFSSYGLDIYVSSDKKNYIHYNELKDTYVWEVSGKKYFYPRRSYTSMFEKHYFELPEEKLDILKKLIKEHSLHKEISRPTVEDKIEKAFNIKDDAFSILDNKLNPCQNHFRQKTKIYNLSLKLNVEDEDKKEKIKQEMIDVQMYNEGFLSFGKLENFSIKLATQNDNPLHGAVRYVGLTEAHVGLEGDDRGFTVGANSSINLEFEKGNLAFRKYTKGYSRLKPKGREFVVDGKSYKSFRNLDENGALYQEFLNIDGLEVEIKHEVGYKDIYYKIIGRKETLDDESGDAHDLQKKWHETFKATKYNNVDYRDKERRNSAGVSLGQRITIYEKDHLSIESDYSVERQFSTAGDVDNYYGVNASVSFEWVEAKKNEKEYASWSATVYGGHKKYLNKDISTSYGVNITKGVQVSDKNFLYITYGLSKDNDIFNKSYTTEGSFDDGNIDATHHLNMEWEYKF